MIDVERPFALFAIVTAIAVLTGTVLGPAIVGLVGTANDRPTVAVVTLRGGTDDANVNAVAKQLRDARANSSVGAVVLRIDSTGGPVDSSEEFYLTVNRTARSMPVVTYVEGAAASGGYYGIVPSDEIIVKPSSTVGSVGVIVSAPLSAIKDSNYLRESFVRTGPDKAQISKDSIRKELEILQASFVDTVMTHRGDDLTLSADSVAEADTYLGTEAVENGFADRIGDLGLAIKRAATLSREIESPQYDVLYFDEAGPTFGFVLGEIDVSTADTDVVYVESDDQTAREFVKPVTYYAVWGVPANETVTNDTAVVTLNE